MSLWKQVTEAFEGVFQRATQVIVVGDDTPIVGEQQLWLQFQRIGGNLTPQQVSNIIREADFGRIWRLVDLANEARQKDGHLHSVLQTRELALKALPWSIEPPQDASGEEKRAAADCERALRDAENLPDLVHHLNGGGVFHGHSTSETINQKVGRFVVPARWNKIHPRRFVFHFETGRLLFNDDGNPTHGVDLREEYPGKFVQYQPIINGDAQVREGLARMLLWMALFRNWSIRDWLQLGEIGWKPWRLGTYKKGADAKDIAILKSALRTLGTTGGAALPDTVKLDVEWPKGTGMSGTASSSHKELFDAMGSEMSKGTLGQTLTTEQGNRGSQSLGNVQNQVRGDILAADALGVAACVTRDVVATFYALNKRSRIRRGDFIFHTEDAVDLVQFSEAMKNFRDAGLRVPAAWVRNQGGIPDPVEDEEVLGGGQPEDDGGEAEDEEEEDDEREDDEAEEDDEDGES